MGRFSDFLKKIQGMFNKNKALPEGSAEKLISVTIPEIVEEPKISEHENFVSELKAQAKQFDLTRMPIDDAILKALEEKGLSTDLSKNPEFKNQMYQMFSSIFQDEYGNGMSPEKIDKLRKVISSGLLKDYSFTITADGNFEYDKANDKNSMTNPSVHKYFTADKQGNMNVIATSHYSFFNENAKAPETFTTFTKKQETFDKNGLQTHTRVGDYQKSDKQSYISGHSYMITRNPDLATANMVVYKEGKDNSSDIRDNHSLLQPILGQADKYSIDISTISEYPEKLNLPIMDYAKLDEFNKKLSEHKKNLEQPSSPQHGTEFYENLMHDYNCIPQAISTVENAYRQNYILNELETISQKSPLIKKIAEQRGLIAREEVTMEQE